MTFGRAATQISWHSPGVVEWWKQQKQLQTSLPRRWNLSLSKEGTYILRSGRSIEAKSLQKANVNSALSGRLRRCWSKTSLWVLYVPQEITRQANYVHSQWDNATLHTESGLLKCITSLFGEIGWAWTMQPANSLLTNTCDSSCKANHDHDFARTSQRSCYL